MNFGLSFDKFDSSPFRTERFSEASASEGFSSFTSFAPAFAFPFTMALTWLLNRSRGLFFIFKKSRIRTSAMQIGDVSRVAVFPATRVTGRGTGPLRVQTSCTKGSG